MTRDAPADLDLPEREAEAIDYLAKDFASFARLMLERMGTLAPQWRERNPADLGVAIVEVLAYAGDYLSYHQDAVAGEAYLATARRRASVRRHLRLVGYRLHEGCNARTWLQVEVAPNSRAAQLPAGTPNAGAVQLPAGTQVLTRVEDLPVVMGSGSHHHEEALAQGSVVFETMHAVGLHPAHNTMALYPVDPGMDAGATNVTLVGCYPDLTRGDAVLFEETAGARRRHVARLCREPEPATIMATGPQPIAVTRIALFAEDAVPFPLGPAGAAIAVRGNLVLVDHGATVPEPEALPDAPYGNRYAPALRYTGLTWRTPFDAERSRREPAAAALRQDARRALPEIVLRAAGPGGGLDTPWRARQDLLESGPFARHFVVETENDGTARLRFGDGQHGHRPPTGERLVAYYRLGNGPAGRIGAGALAHVVLDDGDYPIVAVHNPLAAASGEAPETLERARIAGPRAHRGPESCVTAEDYVRIAERDPEIIHAAACARPCGSWITDHVYAQRAGGKPVDDAFRARLRARLAPCVLAGRGLEVRAPDLLPVEISLRCTLAKGHIPETVRRAVLAVLGDRDLPDGQRAYFHADAFALGQVLFLGGVVDRAMQVPGVALVEAAVFRPWGDPEGSAPVRERIEPGPFAVISVRNQPGQPEFGTLTLTLDGGP